MDEITKLEKFLIENGFDYEKTDPSGHFIIYMEEKPGYYRDILLIWRESYETWLVYENINGEINKVYYQYFDIILDDLKKEKESQ